MSPVLQWISLGILFLVVETMILSLDFLSLGMAAILTGLIAWILPEEYASLLVLSSVFLVLGVCCVIVMRLWIKPRIAKKTHHPSPMSTDRMIGQQYNIVRLENKSYVFADGKYWPTDGAHQFDEGDIVIIQGFEGTLVHVKKI